MPPLLYRHLDHVLCALLLVSRLSDVGTTYLVTPTLALEANPIVRRLGWRFAIVTLAACLVPYVSCQAGVALLVPFLLVSASNAAKIWAARALGERAQVALLVDLARRSKLSHALAGVLASAAFIVLTALVFALFYPSPDEWGFWLATGVLAYGFVIGVHGSLWFVRLFRKAAAGA